MNGFDISEVIIAAFDLKSKIEPQMLLIEDLGFDSLELISLVSLIEESAGLDLGEAPEEYPLLITFEDALNYYYELTNEIES